MPSDIDVFNARDIQVQLCKNPLSLTAGILNFCDFLQKFVWRDRAVFM